MRSSLCIGNRRGENSGARDVLPIMPASEPTDGERRWLASAVRLQAPELKTGQFDRLFNAGPRKPVRGMLIGPERAFRAPRAVVLRQFAAGRISGECVQVRGFRYEHIDLH